MKKLLLALLFAIATMSVAWGNEEAIRTVLPGEENTTGGWYIFTKADAKRVNALCHVVRCTEKEEWRKLLDHPMNTPLAIEQDGKPRESRRAGVTYYFVQVDEQVFIPAGMSALVPLIAESETQKTAESAAPGDHRAPSQPKTWREQFDSMVPWIILIAALLAIARIAYNYFRNRSANQQAEAEPMRADADVETAASDEYVDPALAGPPVIEGGMDVVSQEIQLAVATERMQEIAARTFVPNSQPRDYRIIGDVVRGVLDGEGFVEYSSGEPQWREFRATPAFRALVEHIPSGQRLYRHALWICCNGAYTDMIGGENFTFTPTVDQNGLEVRIAPVLSVTAEEIGRYGMPAYDARHDALATVVLREEPFNHFISGFPSRSRVFMNGNGLSNGPARTRAIDRIASEEAMEEERADAASA